MDDLVIEVGIPTANNEDTIEETLETLASQNRKPDRVIIVDNSTDSTPKIVKEFSKNANLQIDLYKQSSPGKGVGRARQDIFEKFQGDVLACIDTDNILKKNWLEEHAIFHQEHTDFGILSNTSGESREIIQPKESDYFGQSNCSLTKEALSKVEGWDPWFSRGEDWDIRIRLWRAGVKSYAKREINLAAKQIGTEGEGSFFDRIKLWSKKKISAPSSALFLKKYGMWYVNFHPKHFVGDMLSIYSILSLILAPIIYLLGNIYLFLVFLTVPILNSMIYAYYKGPQKRQGFSLQISDFIALPIFFVLSISFITSLIDLMFNEYDWNYDGLDESNTKI